MSIQIAYRIPTLWLLASYVHAQTTVSNRQQLRNQAGYGDLPSCQQVCIAGSYTTDIATDSRSVAAQSDCRTKECFCGAGERDFIYSQMNVCMGNSRASCQTVGNYNGAVSFIGTYCGFQAVLKAETSTAVPTAGTTLQTSLSGNTATIVNTVAGGLPTTQANIAAPTLRAGASTSSEPSSTSTREPTPSAGSAGAGGSGGGGGTSKTTIIAIAVSLGSIVVGIIGILVKVYLHKAEKKRKAEEAAAAAAAQPPVRNFRTKDYGY